MNIYDANRLPVTDANNKKRGLQPFCVINIEAPVNVINSTSWLLTLKCVDQHTGIKAGVNQSNVQ